MFRTLLGVGAGRDRVYLASTPRRVLPGVRFVLAALVFAVLAFVLLVLGGRWASWCVWLWLALFLLALAGVVFPGCR